MRNQNLFRLETETDILRIRRSSELKDTKKDIVDPLINILEKHHEKEILFELDHVPNSYFGCTFGWLCTETQKEKFVTVTLEPQLTELITLINGKI
jgi:hypothetical protein